MVRPGTLRAGPLLLGALALLLLAMPVPPSLAAAPAASSTVTCNPKNTSPSALDIPAKDPGGHAVAGDLLNASLEFRVLGYKKADLGVLLYLPSVSIVFPTYAPIGSLALYLAPKTLNVSGGLWSSPALRSASTKITGSYDFSSSSAYLTTSKIAVMASVPTGSLTLEFRWEWSIFRAKTGVLDAGKWTVPSNGSKSPYLPSIFYPASYVGIASTSGSSVPSNSTYVIGLDGAVASTWFRMVLEYPSNGTEIQSIYENTTANATLFNATLPMAFRNGTGVPAGSYLMHVHDSCEAIVHSLPVTVT